MYVEQTLIDSYLISFGCEDSLKKDLLRHLVISSCLRTSEIMGTRGNLPFLKLTTCVYIIKAATMSHCMITAHKYFSLFFYPFYLFFPKLSLLHHFLFIFTLYKSKTSHCLNQPIESKFAQLALNSCNVHTKTNIVDLYTLLITCYIYFTIYVTKGKVTVHKIM